MHTQLRIHQFRYCILITAHRGDPTTLQGHTGKSRHMQNITSASHVRRYHIHPITPADPINIHPPAPPDPLKTPLQLQLTPWLLPPFHLTLSIGPLCPADPLNRAHSYILRKPVHVLRTAAGVLGIATHGIGAASGWC